MNEIHGQGAYLSVGRRKSGSSRMVPPITASPEFDIEMAQHYEESGRGNQAERSSVCGHPIDWRTWGRVGHLRHSCHPGNSAQDIRLQAVDGERWE